MTNEQITRELVKDYRKLQQTYIQGLMKAYDKERMRKKIDRRATWARQFILKTPTLANVWMVVLQKPPYKQIYYDIEDVEGCAVTWYNCPQGLRVFRPTQALIEVFNPHFFTR